jgi:hypothetical protein
MVAVALLVAGGCALGAGVPSTGGGHAAVDEPEYLLTALSLYEDRDLSIADELADHRERAFHVAPLPGQTSVLPGGRRVSPHDPLLPLLLAVPMGLGGWLAAKLTIAALAGALAALMLWTAVRGLHVGLPLACVGTVLLCVSPPLAVYGSQVYPELPAAIASTAGVAAILRGRGRGLAVVSASVVVLPWLSVKYVPVAAALGLMLLWVLVRRRGDLRKAAVVAVGLGLAAAAYAVAHRAIYGGWTSYATGDHFASTGELSVVGTSPHYVGRASRLAALLTDQDFGLLAWAPVYVLLPLALGAAVRGRARWSLPVVCAGWLTATFLALTMHGFWWPGRQVVVVLPAAGLALLAWCDGHRRRTQVVLALGALGLLAYAGLLLDGYLGDLTWVAGMEAATGHDVVRALLPDYRDPGAGTWAAHVGWSVALVGLLVTGWLRRPPREQPPFADEEVA